MVGTQVVEDLSDLLNFLEEVYKSQICYKEEVYLKNAWRRYEVLWIPLISSYEADKGRLKPPLDIHWMWHLHFHNPVLYNKDLDRKIGSVLDHGYSNGSLDEARSIWEKEYPKEPFEAPFDVETIERFLGGFTTSFSYDLLEASKRQQDFFYQVSLPHFRNKEFQRKCMLRYGQFLNLKSEHPDKFMVPYYDIDLAWHAHMSRPISYKKETSEKLGGKMLDHNDSVGKSQLDDSHKTTSELYKEKYSNDYMISGVAYRGEPPRGKLCNILPEVGESLFTNVVDRKLKLDPAIYFTSVNPLKTKEYELNLTITESNYLGDNVIAQIDKIFSSEAPGENTLFFLDETEHIFKVGAYSSIVIEAEITALKSYSKLCTFVFGTGSKNSLNFELKLPPFFKDEELKTNLELEDEGNLKINFEVLQPESNEEVNGYRYLETIPGTYNDCPMPDNYVDLFGPIPLRELPDHPIDDCKTAHHLVLDKKDDSQIVDVHIAHSLKLGISSVQVFRGNNRMSVAHLITSETLEVDYIDAFNKYKNSPWRSIIIKDNDGDWGILVGHWTGATQPIKQQGPSGLHIRGVSPEPGKPGHFECTFLNLRSKENFDFEIPNKSSQVFANEEFSVHLPNKISVDMNKGEIVLHSEVGNEAVQYINMAFAVSVLYLMVLPTPQDTQMPKRAHVPEKYQPLFYKSKDMKLCVLGGIQNIRSMPSNSTLYYKRKSYNTSAPMCHCYWWHGCHYHSYNYCDEYFACDIDNLDTYVFDKDGEVEKQIVKTSTDDDSALGSHSSDHNDQTEKEEINSSNDDEGGKNDDTGGGDAGNESGKNDDTGGDTGNESRDDGNHNSSVEVADSGNSGGGDFSFGASDSGGGGFSCGSSCGGGSACGGGGGCGGGGDE